MEIHCNTPCHLRQDLNTTPRAGPRQDHALQGTVVNRPAASAMSNTRLSPTAGAREKRERLNMEEFDAELLADYHETSKERLDKSDHTRTQETGTTPQDPRSIDASISPVEGKLAETPLAVDDDQTDERKIHSGKLRRTDSVDRRIDEVAQFFEAVGERPPTSQSDLREIIEDDNLYSDDSDSDEDDTQDQENNVRDSQDQLRNLSSQQEGNLVKPAGSHWPLHNSASKFHSLPGEVRDHNFEYKGIQANPPEITKQGILRGNYAQLHRKAWLEVSDKKHRYGKNLRLYYRHWESLGFPTNKFFDWLDSEGASDGLPKPEIDTCPRSELDSDTVLYVTDIEVTKGYALSIDGDDDSGAGRILNADGEPIQTGPDGWIFVLRDNVMYGARKVTCLAGKSKQRFHHSTFFGGKAVSAAGVLITDHDGILTQVFPHSGHYRPGEADMQRMLFYLYNQGVDLRTFEVDTQQLIHISRQDVNKNGVKAEKKKKIDSLHLRPAAIMAHYLSHKARCIGQGLFADIHRLQEEGTTAPAVEDER